MADDSRGRAAVAVALLGDGIYTVLISDLERSTELWEQHDQRMQPVIVAHNELVSAAVAAHDGYVQKFRGDGVLALFIDAPQAVAAAVQMQRDFTGRVFAEVGELRLRVGITTGFCSLRDGELYGRPPNLASRLEAAGHGGQILLSDATAKACAGDLPGDVELFELGRYDIRGYAEPIVLHSVVADGLRAVFPPPRAQSRGLDELPQEATPLIGRDQLVAEVEDAVREHGLVTLWGPAGVGKTRLAIRAASQVRRPFRQGVRFVDLAAVERPEQVPAAVAAALSAQPFRGAGARDTALRVLRRAQLLLVLDNCGHVLDEVRSLVDDAVAPPLGAHVLATSQEVLGLIDEHAIEIPPLAVPPQGMVTPIDLAAVESVRLFTERAQAVDPDFMVDDRSAAAVAELCRAVDGIPLALELAAARIDVETVQQLAASRSDFVSHLLEHADAARLAESLELSYLHLSERAAVLLRRLAVFAGGFTPEMAAALEGEANRADPHLPPLDELVRSSMVVRDALDSDRLRLLETTREFARARAGLTEAVAARQAHAALMLERAEHWGPRIKTADATTAVGVLRSDMPDHRRAMEWFLENHADGDAARLLVSLFQFAFFDLHVDVFTWAARVAERTSEGAALHAEVWGAAALAAWFSGDTDQAIALGDRAVQPGKPSTIWARTALVNACGYAGRFAELSTHFRALVDELTEHRDPFWQVNGLGYQTISLSMFGRDEQAKARAEQALALSRRLANPYCTGWALYGLGRALARLEPESAREAMAEAEQAWSAIGTRWNSGLAIIEWLALGRRVGDTTDSRAAVLDLMDLLILSGNRSQMSGSFREVGHVLARAGDLEGAALAFLGRRGLPEMPGGSSDPDDDERVLSQLKEQLGGKWRKLETTALALPEADLVTICRDSLLAIGDPVD